MKTRRIDAVKNVDQRVRDERAKKVIMVAMENHPESVYDFDKLIRTHSCKKRADLLERVIMIAASYLPGADRKYLRDWAFCTMPIDWHFGRKHFEQVKLVKVKPENEGWMVYWGDGKTGTLLPFAADGYEPRVGDEAYFYLVQLTVLIGRVVNGHVFSYETIEQRRRRMERGDFS